MQINADLFTDNMALGLLQKRPDAPASGNQTSTADSINSTGSQSDPLLPRLSEGPSSIQDGDPDVQDAADATTIMDALVQSMSTQPRTAVAAHANQLPGNVLSLLQAAED
jgi:hypothetical protein